MDFEKYYYIDEDGNYNLHFANTARFTIPEIKEIFSSFGRVVCVNVTSKETGLRFVKYKTLQETINCLKGIQMDSRIHMLPETLKPNGSKDTIDYEKYYKLSVNGACTIHFLNKKELTLEEIEELFAPYGNNVFVRHGRCMFRDFVFVRFETKEEVKRAIKGFQNSRKISILPQKSNCFHFC